MNLKNLSTALYHHI